MTPSRTNTLDDAAIQAMLDASPFIAFLGLTVSKVDAGNGVVEMTMPLRPELERGGSIKGQFHGGPVASFIDTVGDFAVATVVGGGVPTINFRVDYLRPSGGAFLKGRAVARKIGRTVGVVDVDVTDDQGRLTAIGRATYSAQVG